MAYRSDIEALAARDAVLARELADKQREREAVSQLLEEARAAERAQALEHDVMAGRRTLERLKIVVAMSAVFVIAAGLSTLDGETRGATCSRAEPTVVTLEDRGLTEVTLEPRFLNAVGFATIAELDEFLGGPAPAWEQFMYSRDASGRFAFASEPYRLGGSEPEATFVSDGHGGLWRLAPSEPFVSTGNGPWTRRIWLVPLGSAFRGTIDVGNED